jgi:hypothetical protein
MNLGMELIAENLGIGGEHIIFLVLMVGCVILYAKDFRLGLLLQFIISALCALWFYHAEYNYKYAIITTLIMLALLALSLLFNSNKSPSGVA